MTGSTPKAIVKPSEDSICVPNTNSMPYLPWLMTNCTPRTTWSRKRPPAGMYRTNAAIIACRPNAITRVRRLTARRSVEIRKASAKIVRIPTTLINNCISYSSSRKTSSPFSWRLPVSRQPRLV